jgi:Flp pilus assembly protein TadG
MCTQNSHRSEKGQALIFVLLALSLVIVAALGFAVDSAQLYGHRQMLQVGADAAAQAAALSVYDKTNTAGNNNDFGTASITCAAGSPPSPWYTPCYYAWINGFGPQFGDTVQVDFPTSATGVTELSTSDAPNLVQVTITRTVPTTFMRILGKTSSTVSARGIAGILTQPEEIPIIVTHPFLKSALDLTGGSSITVTGGPARSIQVNSCASKTSPAVGCGTDDSINGTAANNIDLSKAGPTGKGSNLGNFGGPPSTPIPAFLTPFGSAETYTAPASLMADPLLEVNAPAKPGTTRSASGAGTVAPGTSGCPPANQITGTFGSNNWPAPKHASTSALPCVIYQPGYYPQGILTGGGTNAVLEPGIYYLDDATGLGPGGFSFQGGSSVYVDTSGSDSVTGHGVLIYITGNNASKDILNLGGGGSSGLLGTPASSTYKGILFFENHSTTVKHIHVLSGGSGMKLSGSIFLTNTDAAMRANPAVYQALNLTGGSGTAVSVNGEIIAGTLLISGGGAINITLPPSAGGQRQVTLVK